MIINSDWKAICLRYLAIQPGERNFLRLPAECLIIERKDFDFMLAISIRYRNASAKDVSVSRQQEWLDGTISPTFSFMDLEADVKSRLLHRKSWNVKSAIIQELERGVYAWNNRRHPPRDGLRLLLQVWSRRATTVLERRPGKKCNFER